MSRQIVVLTAFALLFLGGSALARTWYVAADGSGDAATIAAAVDSSLIGDVILVGPGTHFVSDISGSGVLLKAGTSLVSETGATETVLKPGSPPQPGVVSTRDNCVVSGFTVLGFGVIGATAPVHVGGDHVEISNNVIHGAGGAPAVAVAGKFASIHNNVCVAAEADGILLAFDFDGAQIHNNVILNGISHSDPCPATVQIQCNLINGSMSTCPFRLYNFSADPMFCGAGNYYLQSDSPCAPGNHPDGIDCGLIGPLPVGCGPVSVEATTWGRVKAMYQD